jgi:hypothetical protein
LKTYRQFADFLELPAGERQLLTVLRQMDCFEPLLFGSWQGAQAIEEFGQFQLCQEVRLVEKFILDPLSKCVQSKIVIVEQVNLDTMQLSERPLN